MSNTKIFNVKAQAFIIPKSASDISDLFSKVMQDKVRWISTLSGKEFDEKTDKIIDFWLLNTEELKSENLKEHGFYITDENEVVYRCDICTAMLPSWLFADKEEGDTVHVTIPGSYCKHKSSEELPALFNFELTLNQTGFRYSHVGRFENAFQYVMPKTEDIEDTTVSLSREGTSNVNVLPSNTDKSQVVINEQIEKLNSLISQIQAEISGIGGE